MPFALIIVAIIAITVGLRGTQGDLYNLLKADFSGPGNFFFWLVSVLVIGALGYIKTIKPVSDALLLLLVLVLFLGKDRGFFTQFNNALNSTQSAAAPSTNSTSSIFGGGSWFPLSGNSNPLAGAATALNNAFSNSSSDSTPGYAGGGPGSGELIGGVGSNSGNGTTTGVDFGGGGTVG